MMIINSIKMPQYLLLRDNKQSGPYSFDELTAKGLKAYDLIWIEGKSAAWRYPSEIEELKPFSPVVEEQPYDRFYKRQDSSVKKAETPAAKPQETPPVKKNTDIKSIPNRRVVVILPGGQRLDRQQEPVVFHETVENKIQKPVTPVKSVGLEEEFPEQFQTISKPVATNRFVKDNRRKGKAAKFISATFALLMIGVLLGWAYNQNFILSQNQQNNEPVTPAQTVKIDDKPATIYNNDGLQQPLSNEILADDSFTTSNEVVADTIATTADIPPVEMVAPKKPAKNKMLAETPKPSQEADAVQPVVTETESIIKPTVENDEAEKKAVKKNISELIKVAKSDFKVGPFGGISNFDVKVTNNSGYTVDLIVVEVKYLLANKKEFKTENIYFKNVSPGASQVQEAPKSPRGITVSSKVALVTSKALGMYQASL